MNKILILAFVILQFNFSLSSKAEIKLLSVIKQKDNFVGEISIDGKRKRVPIDIDEQYSLTNTAIVDSFSDTMATKTRLHEFEMYINSNQAVTRAIPRYFVSDDGQRLFLTKEDQIKFELPEIPETYAIYANFITIDNVPFQINSIIKIQILYNNITGQKKELKSINLFQDEASISGGIFYLENGDFYNLSMEIGQGLQSKHSEKFHNNINMQYQRGHLDDAYFNAGFTPNRDGRIGYRVNVVCDEQNVSCDGVYRLNYSKWDKNNNFLIVENQKFYVPNVVYGEGKFIDEAGEYNHVPSKFRFISFQREMKYVDFHNDNFRIISGLFKVNEATNGDLEAYLLDENWSDVDVETPKFRYIKGADRTPLVFELVPSTTSSDLAIEIQMINNNSFLNGITIDYNLMNLGLKRHFLMVLKDKKSIKKIHVKNFSSGEQIDLEFLNSILSNKKAEDVLVSSAELNNEEAIIVSKFKEETNDENRRNISSRYKTYWEATLRENNHLFSIKLSDVFSLQSFSSRERKFISCHTDPTKNFLANLTESVLGIYSDKTLKTQAKPESFERETTISCYNEVLLDFAVNIYEPGVMNHFNVTNDEIKQIMDSLRSKLSPHYRNEMDKRATEVIQRAVKELHPEDVCYPYDYQGNVFHNCYNSNSFQKVLESCDSNEFSQIVGLKLK